MSVLSCCIMREILVKAPDFRECQWALLWNSLSFEAEPDQPRLVLGAVLTFCRDLAQMSRWLWLGPRFSLSSPVAASSKGN